MIRMTGKQGVLGLDPVLVLVAPLTKKTKARPSFCWTIHPSGGRVPKRLAVPRVSEPKLCLDPGTGQVKGC
jgi:hypothetical protein